MKRPLSGWTRLWIVVAFFMWAGGSWWLYDSPPRRELAPFPCVLDVPFANVEGAVSAEELAVQDACLAEEARHYRENKAAIDAEQAARERDYQWRLWSRVAAVALAPFLLAVIAWLLLAITRWVWRGFGKSA